MPDREEAWSECRFCAGAFDALAPPDLLCPGTLRTALPAFFLNDSIVVSAFRRPALPGGQLYSNFCSEIFCDGIFVPEFFVDFSCRFFCRFFLSIFCAGIFCADFCAGIFVTVFCVPAFLCRNFCAGILCGDFVPGFFVTDFFVPVFVMEVILWNFVSTHFG